MRKQNSCKTFVRWGMRNHQEVMVTYPSKFSSSQLKKINPTSFCCTYVRTLSSRQLPLRHKSYECCCLGVVPSGEAHSASHVCLKHNPKKLLSLLALLIHLAGGYNRIWVMEKILPNSIRLFMVPFSADNISQRGINMIYWNSNRPWSWKLGTMTVSLVHVRRLTELWPTWEAEDLDTKLYRHWRRRRTANSAALQT